MVRVWLSRLRKLDNMKEKMRHNLLLVIIVTVIVALDRWTKLLVSHKLALGESVSPIKALGDFFRIVHWRNTGAAFGLFQNANVVLLVVSLVVSLVVLFYYQTLKRNNVLAKLSLSLVLAGAIGNIIDRIKFGYVIDFIAVGRFPVFNVADSAVTIGVFLMIIYYLIEERKALSARKASGTLENAESNDVSEVGEEE